MDIRKSCWGYNWYCFIYNEWIIIFDSRMVSFPFANKGAKEMKFKIRKEVDPIFTFYWTVPKNIFLRLFHYFPLITMYYHIANKQDPYDCWSSKDEAIQHIERYNSGYYKKTHYSKWVSHNTNKEKVE